MNAGQKAAECKEGFARPDLPGCRSIIFNKITGVSACYFIEQGLEDR
jgi:hypothetical protein